MSLKHSVVQLDVRAVNDEQRIISGYANVFGVTDAYNTRWTPKSFERTIRDAPEQVRVFIGHDVRQLPVGKPLAFRIDEHGLYTETLIAPTQAGDDLLKSARFWQEHGQPVGMSVGFRAVKSHWDGDVEVFDDVDLREYSFVAFEAVPGSQVTGVRDEQPTDPQVVLSRAIAELTEARDEIAARVDAARVLGDDVSERALSEQHVDALRGVISRIRSVLEAPEAPVEPVAEMPDPHEEVERFLAGLSSHRETLNA